jgi:beta-galactosidase
MPRSSTTDVTDPIVSHALCGGEVQYFRLDPRFWRPVLQRLVDAGLRTVTTYVQWGTHAITEPDAAHPAGHFDFDGRTDPRRNLLGYLDLVAQLGLQMNFRCGPFTCNEMPHGGYPRWITCGDPSMMVWDHTNRPTQGYWIALREGMQPSYLHPDYLRACRAWIDAVAPILRPRLRSAGGFVTMVNLDNEVSYITRDALLESDYNPVNVAPGGFYQQFLMERYGSLEALRDAWGMKLASLEDAQPPRATPPTLDRDFAFYADWIAFKTWSMARYIRTLREMHEANGVADVTFMTNINPHRPEGVPVRFGDFEAAVGPRGIVGYDFYRGAFLSYSGYQSMARVLKLMNASLRYTWSAEFMSGLWNKDMTSRSRISDDHMRFMARCALAHGCKAISWFMFHDRDTWGDSPVSSQGHARPSLAVLQETVSLLRERVSDWDTLAPACDVAIVYDLPQHLHTAIGDPSPCDDQKMHVGAPSIDGIPAGQASREYEGLFRLVEQTGRQAAAVDVMQDASGLSAHPVALVPGGAIASSAASAALRAFVQRGGTLVVAGPWPGRDEHGKPTPLLGIDRPEKPGPFPLGDGLVVWHRDWIAQADPEHESLEQVADLARLLGRSPTPHVSIRPVSEVRWVDWKEGGGTTQRTQPRNLASAVLQRRGDGTPRLVFAMNHYVDAAEFELTLRDAPAGTRLVDAFDPSRVIPLRDGRATLSIDRKACDVFLVEVAARR